MDNWLQALKPGDRVIASEGGDFPVIKVIHKVTPTQIVIRGTRSDHSYYETRYRRTDGHMCGGGDWSTSVIEELTEARYRVIKLDRSRRFLARVDWKKIEDDVVLKIRAMVNPT